MFNSALIINAVELILTVLLKSWVMLRIDKKINIDRIKKHAINNFILFKYMDYYGILDVDESST